MIENILVHYNTYNTFKSDLDAGLISQTSVCFIKDTNQIYTHGQYYNSSNNIDSQKIEYIEGTSDSDGVISSINLPEPEEGYENMIISIVYYDTNAGMWSNCVCYKPTGNTQLITGGPKYGVSVVVSGVEAYRCGNAKYRVFYMKIKS